jgi:hypothetical protein
MARPNDPNSRDLEREQTDAGDLTPTPRYDEQLGGDAFEVMRKYQVVALPPNERLKLMQIKLPAAPPELLEDTLPPNGSVTAPLALSALDETTEAPILDSSVPRSQRKQTLRTIALVVATVGLVLLLLGVLITR